MEFNRLLSSNAKRLRAPVLRFADRELSLTCRDLLDRSGPYCAFFRQRGLAPGDRIALWMGNVPEYVLAYTAALRLGLVTVPFSVYEEAEKISAACAACGCGLLLYDSRNRFVRATLDRSAVPAGWLDVTSFAAAGGLRLPAAEDSGPYAYDWGFDETYCILHSSGSTGVRKAICKTFTRTFGGRASLRLLRLSSFLVWVFGGVSFYNVCPWYHNTGNIPLLFSLCGVRYLQTVTEYFNPVHAAQDLARERPTLWLGTATMLYRVCCVNPVRDLPFPGTILSAGEALSNNILQTLSAQKGCRLLLSFYGTTEDGPVSSLVQPLGPLPLRYRAVLFLLRRFGLIAAPMQADGQTDFSSRLGAVYQNMEVRIRGEDGRLLPDGEAGEIFIKKAGAQRVYLEQDRLTEEHSTGDVGYKCGRELYLLGRKKELIIRSGENIIPSEIEEKLLACPGVTDAVVCGVPSQDHGEDVCACLQTDGPPDLEAIRARMRDCLPRFMQPQHYLLRDGFPYNASGKKDRKRIAEEARASLGL